MNIHFIRYNRLMAVNNSIFMLISQCRASHRTYSHLKSIANRPLEVKREQIHSTLWLHNDISAYTQLDGAFTGFLHCKLLHSYIHQIIRFPRGKVPESSCASGTSHIFPSFSVEIKLTVRNTHEHKLFLQSCCSWNGFANVTTCFRERSTVTFP